MENFSELKQLENILKKLEPWGEVSNLSNIKHKRNSFPIWAIRLGPKDPQLPCLGIFAGVHGLEKIGTHLCTHFLRTLSERLKWDYSFRELLTKIRIISIPLINPVGMYNNSRCNGNGVDLMRNSPTEANGKTIFLASGHRISAQLPWYRGKNGELELENKVLVNFLNQELFPSPFSLSIDLHSGFGMKDRISYPYAKSKDTFPNVKTVLKLKQLLDSNYPHHFYKLEAQHESYQLHGDMWDYIYDLHKEKYGSVPHKTYIPLTLEMGSWIWIKKNPKQLLSPIGLFNPVKRHRYQRIIRRHWRLLDFLISATVNNKNWSSK